MNLAEEAALLRRQGLLHEARTAATYAVSLCKNAKAYAVQRAAIICLLECVRCSETQESALSALFSSVHLACQVLQVPAGPSSADLVLEGLEERAEQEGGASSGENYWESLQNDPQLADSAASLAGMMEERGVPKGAVPLRMLALVADDGAGRNLRWLEAARSCKQLELPVAGAFKAKAGPLELSQGDVKKGSVPTEKEARAMIERSEWLTPGSECALALVSLAKRQWRTRAEATALEAWHLWQSGSGSSAAASAIAHSAQEPFGRGAFSSRMLVKLAEALSDAFPGGIREACDAVTEALLGGNAFSSELAVLKAEAASSPTEFDEHIGLQRPLHALRIKCAKSRLTMAATDARQAVEYAEDVLTREEDALGPSQAGRGRSDVERLADQAMALLSWSLIQEADRSSLSHADAEALLDEAIRSSGNSDAGKAARGAALMRLGRRKDAFDELADAAGTSARKEALTELAGCLRATHERETRPTPAGSDDERDRKTPHEDARSNKTLVRAQGDEASPSSGDGPAAEDGDQAPLPPLEAFFLLQDLEEGVDDEGRHHEERKTPSAHVALCLHRLQGRLFAVGVGEEGVVGSSSIRESDVDFVISKVREYKAKVHSAVQRRVVDDEYRLYDNESLGAQWARVSRLCARVARKLIANALPNHADAFDDKEGDDDATAMEGHHQDNQASMVVIAADESLHELPWEIAYSGFRSIGRDFSLARYLQRARSAGVSGSNDVIAFADPCGEISSNEPGYSDLRQSLEAKVPQLARDLELVEGSERKASSSEEVLHRASTKSAVIVALPGKALSDKVPVPNGAQWAFMAGKAFPAKGGGLSGPSPGRVALQRGCGVAIVGQYPMLPSDVVQSLPTALESGASGAGHALRQACQSLEAPHAAAQFACFGHPSLPLASPVEKASKSRQQEGTRGSKR